MVTNRYFDFRNRRSEQNLIEDLIIESIQIYGEDFIYIPRTHQKDIDPIYGEDPTEHFDDFFQVEMFIESTDGFQGEGHLFRKFGIDIKDQMTLVVSRARFTDLTEGPNDLEPSRPRGGDLLYLPESESLFEVRYVTENEIFYPLGSWFVYTITAEQYSWSHQSLETGIDQIDEIAEELDYQVLMHFEDGAMNFAPGEIIYQGTYPDGQADAICIQPVDNQTIRARNIRGEFLIDQNVMGVNSGISRILIEYDDKELIKDGSGKNKDIQDVGD
jgi:hypothetical protein